MELGLGSTLRTLGLHYVRHTDHFVNNIATKHPTAITRLFKSEQNTMSPDRDSSPSSASVALEKLRQFPTLKLLAIAEALSPKDALAAQKRDSAVSDDSEQNGDTHPAALQADLLHYKVPLPTHAFAVIDLNAPRNCSANFASATSNKSRKRSSCAALRTIHRA